MTINQTTELREKLRERGIEYTTNDHMGVFETTWNGFKATQLSPHANLIMAVTPEQAIAATLENDECTPHGKWKRITQTQEVRHVFCECGYELGMDERDSFPFERTRLFAMPNYCKECGRKIRKAVKR